ncbi:hypothetical protein EYZ11_008773 [Aspergillus tanneri]|uniref:Uncharacterized protein n=1 Tax=Aspergillus tanneri TaxID=1220188 RepID=A0A4S3J9N9_9EURO|nr:hypothetical protein EYZ11_008773 [Aspergillus tanneri]
MYSGVLKLLRPMVLSTLKYAYPYQNVAFYKAM